MIPPASTRRLDLIAPISQEADEQLMTEILQSPVGQGDQHQIPQHIHRFWSGGPLTQSAMKTLIDSAVHTKGTQWKHTLWYSTIFEDEIKAPKCIILEYYRQDQKKIQEREQQRKELMNYGYRIRPIESLVIEGKSTTNVTKDELTLAASMAANAAKRGEGYDSLIYFSDIARLMYLHAEGGHHMDIDIGMGYMDINKAYYHNDPEGQVPLMGTIVRDFTHGGGGLEFAPKLDKITRYQKNPYKSGITQKQYRQLVEETTRRACSMAGTFNALIATRPGTNNVMSATDNLLKSFRQRGEFSTGMAVNPNLLAGQRNQGFEDRLERGLKYSVPPYLLRLMHLTPDSNL